MTTITTNKLMKWGGGGIVTLATLWGFHAWVAKEHLPLHMLSRAEAQTLQEQVKGAVTSANAAAEVAKRASDRLADYIVNQQWRDERAALDRLNGDLQDTLLWETANGANDISRARKADLNLRIRETEQRIHCIENPDSAAC